jgi:hypothetical protein
MSNQVNKAFWISLVVNDGLRERNNTRTDDHGTKLLVGGHTDHCGDERSWVNLFDGWAPPHLYVWSSAEFLLQAIAGKLQKFAAREDFIKGKAGIQSIEGGEALAELELDKSGKLIGFWTEFRLIRETRFATVGSSRPVEEYLSEMWNRTNGSELWFSIWASMPSSIFKSMPVDAQERVRTWAKSKMDANYKTEVRFKPAISLGRPADLTVPLSENLLDVILIPDGLYPVSLSKADADRLLEEGKKAQAYMQGPDGLAVHLGVKTLGYDFGSSFWLYKNQKGEFGTTKNPNPLYFTQE